MKSTVKVIELHTENLGTFTFTKHFNAPNTEAYDALTCFESNNWEKLGNTYYVVTFLFEDDTNSTVTLKGINATAELAALIDPEFAEEYDATFSAYAD